MTSFHRILWTIALFLGVAAMPGCVKSHSFEGESDAFETRELDAVLAITVDMSGSFANSWEDRAYKLFLSLMDRFFTEEMGSESRVVLGQISAAEDVILFEGTPAELRRRFQSPEDLNSFLGAHSDPDSSPVYEATGKTVEYVASMPGLSERTRMLTVVLSDMADSSDQEERPQVGWRMVDRLTRYRERGGALALYFVSPDEMSTWQWVVNKAGFEPGQYVIANSIIESPQLPRFD